jgi:hypothetical protein
VLARLTRRFEGDRRLDVVEQIVGERLARKGDSFAARAEIVGLVERTQAEVTDPERGGRLALLWIRAMAGVAAVLPARQHPDEPYASFIDARKSALWWNEVGANWLLAQDALSELHTRHRDTSSADEIAWSAVGAGLGGECEGYLPCYVERTSLLQGEYLRRHSNGRHVDDAVSDVGRTAASWLPLLSRPDAFSPEKDCGEMSKWLTPLRASVASTRASERDAVLARLDEIGKRCGEMPLAALEPLGTPPAAPVAPAPADQVPSAPLEIPSSRAVTMTVLGISVGALAAVAAIVMARHRRGAPANRITLT